MSGDFVSYSNDELNDTTWSRLVNNSSFETALAPLQTPSIIDSFNSTAGAVLSYGDSLQVSFPANNYVALNGLVTGTVKVEITVLKKRSDFIRFFKPTITTNALLDAANEIDIKLTKNGREVFLQHGAFIKLKLKDILASADMKFFVGTNGIVNGNTHFLWLYNSDGKVNIWQDTLQGGIVRKLGYEFVTNKLRWFGGCNIIDSSLPKTRLNVTLPLNYTNKNTTVFVVFKNRKTVVALSADNDKKLFYTLNIPTGSEVTLLSLTRINNDFYLGSKVVSITNANAISLKPEKKELFKIFEFLGQL